MANLNFSILIAILIIIEPSFKIQRMRIIFFMFLLGISLMSCRAQRSITNSEFRSKSGSDLYSFNNPDRTFELPEQLKEISGLTLSPDGQQLCAINDENGIIYFIDKKEGEVKREVKFHKNGDYEGIETVGKSIFIVKSTGTVYKVDNLEKDSVSFKKGKYLLKKENDTEGLGFDSKNNQLLFACKGRACLHSGCTIEGCLTKKSIYRMDMNRNRVAKEPAFDITIKTVLEFLKKNKPEEEANNFESFIDKDDGHLHFHPSALAVHPISGDIFILSSKGKTLIVLSEDGEIKQMEKLNKKIHRQPEGITFDKDGTMYISNEGKKEKKGKIYVYNYR